MSAQTSLHGDAQRRTHDESARWDEPTGAVPRGVVIVVPGRGEGAAEYERFGRRISADSWKVRLVPLDLDHPDATRESIVELLADESLPSPKVLLGVDAAANWVGRIVDEVDADAAILAGTALPTSAGVGDWAAELDARSACPVHRAVLESDPRFERGALEQPLPAEWAVSSAPSKPTLVLHGEADSLTPLADAIAPYVDAPNARVKSIRDGRHDVLNDAGHRAVAATIVLFLESLRLGVDLPDIINDHSSKDAAR